MAEVILPVLSAFWLGVLTSISPCPLATNILAISFVGRRVDRPRNVLFSGLLYTAGRAATYVLLGTLLVASLLSAPYISQVLQKYMNAFLGPLLILVGMVLLELISFNTGAVFNTALQRRVETMGVWGAIFLGILFALSFCPTSAALFFGSLLPLPVNRQSGILIPAVYGIGTGLPVLIFAVLLGFSANKLAKAYDRIAAFEQWARRITGIIFILVGIYFCLTNIFEVSLSL
jgi:cytochrome c-type biogenesis protein